MNAVTIPLSIVGILAASALNAFGQVSVTSGAYSQNFDGLAITGTSMPWVNNSTLPGWYAHQTTDTTESPISQISTGQSSNPRFAWYGSTGDYSLGSSYSGFTGNVSFGVRLINNAGASVSEFSVSFSGEQWRRSSNSAQATDSLTFSYQIFDAGIGSLATQDWISVPSLEFVSPNATDATSANLNGNASSNRIMYSNWISGISLAEGQELWLRWTATDKIAFSDHGLAIDDLAVTFGAIPEPASYALGFGACAWLVALRRKRRSQAQ